MCCNICRNARCDGAGAQKKESKESHRRGRGCLLPRLGLCKSRETVLGNHRKSCNGPLPPSRTVTTDEAGADLMLALLCQKSAAWAVKNGNSGLVSEIESGRRFFLRNPV
jgi:hypothetical protein